MKYGESAFDILYLMFAVISGCFIIIKSHNRTERLMGISAIVLGCGDAFHLIPRVLGYFVSRDMTAALGIGKLITSVTMTVFYVLLYYVWLGYYTEPAGRNVTAAVWIFAAVRIALCLFPQNGWLENSNDMTWGIIRNIPFVALGAVICFLYFKKRKAGGKLGPVWVYIMLSFLFYIPVAAGAGVLPILGMLMLPKTICYVLMISAFLSSIRENRRLDISIAHDELST